MSHNPARDIFEEIERLTNMSPIDASRLASEDLPEVVRRLKNAGHRMTDIAKYIGKSRRQTYNYLKKAKDGLVEELENKKYLDIFVDTLDELESRRDQFLREADMISRAGEREGQLDENGDPIQRRGSTRDYAELCRLIRDYDKLIIDLKKSVGFIPTASESNNLYTTLGDKNPDNFESTDNDPVELNTAELQQALLHKLQNKAPRLSSGSPLKDKQDENIL